MFEGFKKFILRGNVIELAVAVIVGAAFTAIVKAFTDGVVQPILAVFGGSPEIGLGFYLKENNPSTFINLGAILSAAINFLIIAAVIYFILILPMNKFAEIQARRKGLEPEEAAATETELLAEIRDLLLENRGAHTTGAHAADATAAPGSYAPPASDKPTGRHAE